MRTDPQDVELALVSLVAAMQAEHRDPTQCRRVLDRAATGLCDIALGPGSRTGQPEAARDGALLALHRVCMACGGCPRGAVIAPPPRPDLRRVVRRPASGSPLADSDPPR